MATVTLKLRSGAAGNIVFERSMDVTILWAYPTRKLGHFQFAVVISNYPCRRPRARDGGNMLNREDWLPLARKLDWDNAALESIAVAKCYFADLKLRRYFTRASIWTLLKLFPKAGILPRP